MSAPRRRRRFAALTLLLLTLAVLWAIQVHDEPLPSPASVTAQVTTPGPSPRATVAPQRPSTQSSAYDFASVRAALLRERLSLAGCLMRNPDFAHGELRMTLHWAPQGKLERVALLPDAGEEVRKCLTRVSGQWPMKPHTSLQPFSYTAVLQPRGI